MQTDQYTFEDKVITLVDEELGLQYREVFDPIQVPEKRKPHQRLPDGHALTCFGPPDNPEETWVVEKEGLWDGQYLLCYPNGNPKLMSYYVKGELHGPSTFYSEEGSVIAYSWYIKGLQQGKSWLYYPSGVVYGIQRYLDGVWHGKQEYFYANGNPKTIMNYLHGRLESVHLFSPDGVEKKKGT